MQILVIEQHPADIAHSLCDKHVVQQLEVVSELLGLAHTRNNEMVPPLQNLHPRLVHLEHKFTKWVSDTSGNYDWTYALAIALCDEYQHRYGFSHWYRTDIMRMLYAPFKLMLAPKPVTPAPVVMPARYVQRSVLASYRSYYSQKLALVPLWTRRLPPTWFYFT